MAATIHVLHPASAPVAGFIRVGHTGQKKLEALCAAGRFPYRRARVDHFLLNLLDPAVRTARFASRLKIPDESLKRLFDESKIRLIRFRDALADLHASENTPTYLKPVPFRGGGRAINAVLGH